MLHLIESRKKKNSETHRFTGVVQFIDVENTFYNKCNTKINEMKPYKLYGTMESHDHESMKTTTKIQKNNIIIVRIRAAIII